MNNEVEVGEARAQKNFDFELEKHRLEMERINRKGEIQESAPTKRPKPSDYKEGDDLDSYIRRFEIYANQCKWANQEWGCNFSYFLSAKALSIYNSLSIDQTQDWDVVKSTLLNVYNFTEEGYRSKLRQAKCHNLETHSQFLVRLDNYLARWIDMSSINKTYDALKELLLREQLLNCCAPEIRIILREQGNLPTSELVRKADSYEEARKYETPVTKQSNLSRKPMQTQYSNRNVSQAPSMSKHSGVSQCRRCGRLGHEIKSCHASRHAITGKSLTANACLFQEEIEPSDNDSEDEREVEIPNTALPPSSFAPVGTQLYKMVPVPLLMSVNEIEVAKGNAMPLAMGHVNGHRVQTLRDTGCSGVVIRESLVDSKQITKLKRTCVLLDGSKIDAKVARLVVDTPYYKGWVNAVCFDTPQYDLIIGNIKGAKCICKYSQEMENKAENHHSKNNSITRTATVSFGKNDAKADMSSLCENDSKILTQKSSPCENDSRISTQSSHCDNDTMISTPPGSQRKNDTTVLTTCSLNNEILTQTKHGVIPLKTKTAPCKNDAVEHKENMAIGINIPNVARLCENDTEAQNNEIDVQKPVTANSGTARNIETSTNHTEVQLDAVHCQSKVSSSILKDDTMDDLKSIVTFQSSAPPWETEKLLISPSKVKETVSSFSVETRAQSKAKPSKRLAVTELGDDDHNINTDTLQSAQQNDDSLSMPFKLAKTGKVQQCGKQSHAQFRLKGKLLYRFYTAPKINYGQESSQLVVPHEFRKRVMKVGHDSIMGGHLAYQKTIDRITSQFYWPNIHAEVKRYCQSCDVCQKTIPRGKVGKVPLGQMPLIGIPFQRVGVDLVGPIKSENSRKFQYILVLVDYATRYPEAIPLKNIRAITVAEALVDMYSRLGIPQEILTDMGKQFVSEVMREVARLLCIRQLTTTPRDYTIPPTMQWPCREI